MSKSGFWLPQGYLWKCSIPLSWNNANNYNFLFETCEIQCIYLWRSQYVSDDSNILSCVWGWDELGGDGLSWAWGKWAKRCTSQLAAVNLARSLSIVDTLQLQLQLQLTPQSTAAVQLLHQHKKRSTPAPPQPSSSPPSELQLKPSFSHQPPTLLHVTQHILTHKLG